MLISLTAPILGALIVLGFGRLFGRRGGVLITTVGLGLSFVYSWYLFFKLSGGAIYQVSTYIGSWFSSFTLLEWAFTVDEISSIMLVVVSTVSFLVHLYSTKYMSDDPHIVRFFSYLSLFTVFMYVLVLGNNLFILFVGWEGVGLCSYLLINFWFTRLQANKAALKAMIVNRVGDISLIAACGLSISLAGSLTSPILMSSSAWLKGSVCSALVTVSCLLFLAAAVGKSAQVGLHTWLPDAMEGPTPVSALIHAATMVTAGVFLLIRMSNWLNNSAIGLWAIMIFGATTAVFAGTVGLTQFDIKRVIAYSTCSQLGYMVLICGCAVYSIGLFHLFNHAFFKALLFLGSGSIIHAMSDEQDMRRYGALHILTPALGQVFLFASIALMGLPFLAGFYSKDSILEVLFVADSEVGLWGYWIGLIAALLTTGYSFKVGFWTFYSSTCFGFKRVISKWHNPSQLELVILSCLVSLSVLSGYLFKDQFIGLGTHYFKNATRDLLSLNDAEFIPVYIKLIPLFATVFVLIGAYYLSTVNKNFLFYSYLVNKPVYEAFKFLSHKWYFNLIQNRMVSAVILEAGYDVFWIWDRWLLEQYRFK